MARRNADASNQMRRVGFLPSFLLPPPGGAAPPLFPNLPSPLIGTSPCTSEIRVRTSCRADAALGVADCFPESNPVLQWN